MMTQHRLPNRDGLWIILTIIATCLFLAFLMGCSDKDNNPIPAQSAHLTVYSTDMAHRWGIVLDGVDRGSITQTSSAPECGASGFGNYDLTVGVHTVQVYSLSGLSGYPETTITLQAGCTKKKLP